MAESVDALVSNTSGATRAGSTPALGTSVQNLRKQSAASHQTCSTFFVVTKFLLSCSLTVFQNLGLHGGVGIGITVAGLLILFLCQQQIAHLGGAHPIVVFIQS